MKKRNNKILLLIAFSVMIILILPSALSQPSYVINKSFNNGIQTQSYTIPIELSSYLNKNNLKIKDVTNNPTVTKALQQLGKKKVCNTMQSGNLTAINRTTMQPEYYDFSTYDSALYDANDNLIFRFYTIIILKESYMNSDILQLVWSNSKVVPGSLLYYFFYRSESVIKTYDVDNDYPPIPYFSHIYYDSSVNVHQKLSQYTYHAYMKAHHDYVTMNDDYGWFPDYDWNIYEI
jgi:hypothetical protein